MQILAVTLQSFFSETLGWCWKWKQFIPFSQSCFETPCCCSTYNYFFASRLNSRCFITWDQHSLRTASFHINLPVHPDHTFGCSVSDALTICSERGDPRKGLLSHSTKPLRLFPWRDSFSVSCQKAKTLFFFFTCLPSITLPLFLGLLKIILNPF